ncbi:MAG: hypothetical protein RBS17_01695 [Coriobacteriia bacterium]|nr:hypothetical protein [Coriobacteriia bacterium]
MSKKRSRIRAAFVFIILIAFFSLGCGDFEISWIGDDDGSPASQNVTEPDREEPRARDSRLAEGEIYRVKLTFGEAMLDGGRYSVTMENPRSSWRDIVRWDCDSLAEYEEDYRFYESPFFSKNLNVQDPPQMDGEYVLTISNGFGYTQSKTLTWSNGQFIDGGYAEYDVP